MDFEEAIEQEQARLKGELEKMLDDENYYSYNYREYSYLSRGIYIKQIKSWLDLFPKEQFLIIKSEDFFTKTPKIYKQVLDFIGLPNYELKEYKLYNGNRYPPMKPEMKEKLANYFYDYNEELYTYLGVNFN